MIGRIDPHLLADVKKVFPALKACVDHPVPLLAVCKFRESDRGLLWEHLVLDTLRTVVDDHNLFYWRDKSGREVDFVVKGRRKQSDAIECKINPDHFDPAHLAVFRSLYPEGKNYVLSPNIKSSYQRRYGKLKVDFISIKQIYDLK